MKISEILTEMAVPRASDIAKTYYHGTQKDPDKIWAQGIAPQNVQIVKGPNLVPRAGKVYLTPDIGYAQMYAIGGDIAGYTTGGTLGFGYIFEIPGSALSDIEPDEDDVGRLIHDVLVYKKHLELDWLADLAMRKLTPRQLRELKGGDYVMWAHAGKKLIPLLTPAQHLQIIDAGANVANTGTVRPSACYRINLEKVPLLKRDGSNFFEYAEKIKP